ncbi:MAG: tetratricopeptide repeat protein [Cyanobacteria bacterium J06642_11]
MGTVGAVQHSGPALFREDMVSSQLSAALSMISLGEDYDALGQHERAIESLEQALSIEQ